MRLLSLNIHYLVPENDKTNWELRKYAVSDALNDISTDLIYSEPWSGRWPAFTTWVLFQRLSDGREFYVYNLNLDAFSNKNRVRGAKLIAERINGRSNPDVAVILAGDFNLLKGSNVLKTLDDAALSRAPANGSTYHFGKGINLYGAIDHLYFSPGFELMEAGVLQRKWADEWPSDHYPLYGSFSLGD